MSERWFRLSHNNSILSVIIVSIGGVCKRFINQNIVVSVGEDGGQQEYCNATAKESFPHYDTEKGN